MQFIKPTSCFALAKWTSGNGRRASRTSHRCAPCSESRVRSYLSLYHPCPSNACQARAPMALAWGGMVPEWTAGAAGVAQQTEALLLAPATDTGQGPA